MKTTTDIMAENGWLSVSKASEASGFSRYTVHRLIRDGKVEAHRVGNRWYIDRQSLADYVQAPPIRDRVLSA